MTQTRIRLVVAALAIALALPVTASLAEEQPRGRQAGDQDPLAVRIWSDPGRYVYRGWRLDFEVKDDSVEPNWYQLRRRRDSPRDQVTDWRRWRSALPFYYLPLRRGSRMCVQVRAREGGVAGPCSGRCAPR